MSTQFNSQKQFYFNLFSLFKQLYITIQFSVSTVLMSKTVQFQIIQFSISTQFKCKYSLIVKTFLFEAIQFTQAVLIQLIKFSISTDFVYTQLNVKKVLFKAIQFSLSRVSKSKTVLFQIIQFSISTQFKCKFGFIVKNISISSYSF